MDVLGDDIYFLRIIGKKKRLCQALPGNMLR